MGKKSWNKKRKSDFIKAKPDEVHQYGPLRIARYGRYVQLLNTATPQAHAALLKRLEKANEKILAELHTEVEDLQKLIANYDPVELMHRAAYMVMPLFMKYRSEQEYGRDEVYNLPALEYLQYLIARSPVHADGNTFAEMEWEEIWGKAIKVMHLTRNHIGFRKTSGDSTSLTDDLRFMLDSRRLAIRVRRYSIFLTEYLEMSLSPYESWIKDIYGASTREIINELKKVDEYLSKGVPGRYRDFRDSTDEIIHNLREKGYIVDPSASPEEVERTRQALASIEFESQHKEVDEKARLALTSAIFDITNLTSLPKPLLSLLSVKPGESILTELTGPNHDDLSPLSTSVLHYKPFLEANGRFYCFYHSGFEDRMAEIIEADLFDKFPNKVSELAKRRSDQIELTAKNLLVTLTKPDFVFQNLYYPNPDKTGDLTELDILLSVDDILFLVEVKAGGFSGPASRGAPKSLENELSDLIIRGQQQSERAEKYIKANAEVKFFDETGKKVLHTIRHADFRKIFRVIVTREELGWVGARIAVLSRLDPNLSKSFPWHVSIDDLRIIAELFSDNELRFIHFLEQRLKASSEVSLSQHDEIEHVGLYNKMNLYHELPVKDAPHLRYDSSYMHDIDIYFTEKNAGESPVLPTQSMPSRMKTVVDALRDSHMPGRCETASIILSIGAEGRNEFEDGLADLEKGRKERRQRTLRLPFTNEKVGLSITCADDANWSEELIRSGAQMEQGGCERWPVVQLENSDRCKIKRIEKIYRGRFSDAELARGKSHLEERVRRVIAREEIGRNDECPCGSGKKFKKCHGSNA